MEDKNSKRGYLNDDFKIFIINDKKDMEFEYHHTTLIKLLFF